MSMIRRIALALVGLLLSGCAHAPTGTLMGRVIDEHGQAVVGARVCLEGISEQPVTHSDGRFKFPKLLAGVYDAVVKAPSFDSRFREGVRIEAGRTIEIELVLTEPAVGPTGTVEGTVTDDRGNGLDSAAVWLLKGQRGTVTDVRGRFSFDRVPVGTYLVRTKAAGYVGQTRDSVRVNDGQTTRIDFKLEVRLGRSIDVPGTRTPIHKDGG